MTPSPTPIHVITLSAHTIFIYYLLFLYHTTHPFLYIPLSSMGIPILFSLDPLLGMVLYLVHLLYNKLNFGSPASLSSTGYTGCPALVALTVGKDLLRELTPWCVIDCRPLWNPIQFPLCIIPLWKSLPPQLSLCHDFICQYVQGPSSIIPRCMDPLPWTSHGWNEKSRQHDQTTSPKYHGLTQTASFTPHWTNPTIPHN